MDNIGSQVLLYVTTPLALAGLCLILIAGSIRLIVKQKATVTVKLTLRYGFWLSLVLSLLANSSYLLALGLSSDIRISGVVLDSEGRPVDSVRLIIPSQGKGISSEDGSFDFNVPGSRSSDSYEMAVIADGYDEQKLSLNGKHPKPLFIRLESRTLRADDLLGLLSKMFVTEYLGQPMIVLDIKSTNPLPREIMLWGPTITMQSPEGLSLILQQTGRAIHGGAQVGLPSMQAYSYIPLKPRESIEHDIFLSQSNPETFGIINEVASQLREKGLFEQAQMPTFSGCELDSVTSARVQAVFDKLFCWSEGTWHIQIAYTVDQKTFSRKFDFSLTKDDVSRLRQSRERYARGMDFNPQWGFLQNGGKPGSLWVDLREGD